MKAIAVLLAAAVLALSGPLTAAAGEPASGPTLEAAVPDPGAPDQETGRDLLRKPHGKVLPLSRQDNPLLPLRVEELTLPAALILGFAPTPATPLGKGAWSFETRYSHTNNFIYSANVGGFLRQRGERRPLTREEVDQLLELPGDTFLLDGEFGELTLAVQYGFGERWHLGLSLPYFIYTGGGLDSTISSFHDAAGFSLAGREFMADNLFQVIFDFERVQGEPLVLLDAPTGGGFGDPSLTFHYAFPSFAGGWTFGFELAAKVPIASQEELLSSGHSDYGAQLTLDRRWRKHALVANIFWVRAGDFLDLETADPRGVSVALMRDLGRGVTGIFQLLSADGVFRNVTGSNLADVAFQATLGLRWRIGEQHLTFGVTENLFSFNNTPDIGLHVSLGTFVP